MRSGNLKQVSCIAKNRPCSPDTPAAGCPGLVTSYALAVCAGYPAAWQLVGPDDKQMESDTQLRTADQLHNRLAEHLSCCGGHACCQMAYILLWEEAHEGHHQQLGKFNFCINGTSQPLCAHLHESWLTQSGILLCLPVLQPCSMGILRDEE